MMRMINLLIEAMGVGSGVGQGGMAIRLRSVDDSGSVSVSEVQKAINAYLKLL